jgi:hypothetical protein
MEPFDTGQAGLDRWADQHPRAVVIGGPKEGPDVTPCPAIVTHQPDGTPVVRVAWRLDEIELAALARGGTLWLSTWGGLPIHALHVDHAAPAPEAGF